MSNLKANELAKRKSSSASIIEQIKGYMIDGDFYAAATGIKLILKQNIPGRQRNQLILFLGIILKTIGNNKEALKCFDKIIKDDTNTQAFIHKAGIQVDNGDYMPAWDTLRNAPKDKFGSDLFKKYASVITIEINKPEIPLKLLSENQSLMKSDMYLHVLYIISLMRTGKTDDAQKEIINIMQNSKDKTDAILLLEWISIITQQEQEAMGMIDKILKTTENIPCEVDFATGAMAYLTNNTGRAQDLLRSASSKMKITKYMKNHIAMQIMASSLRLMSADIDDLMTENTALTKENDALKQHKDDTDIKTEAILGMMTRKDCFLGEKCKKIGDTADFIARHDPSLTPAEIKEIRIAGYLSNLGMLYTPNEVFTKKTPLTNEEKLSLREHPIVSAAIAKEFGYSEKIVLMLRHHHEKIDGTGYPGKLKEDKIPYGAKIIGLAEFFVEVTNDGPRTKAIPVQEAVKTVQRLAGIHFSREMCHMVKQAYSK